MGRTACWSFSSPTESFSRRGPRILNLSYVTFHHVAFPRFRLALWWSLGPLFYSVWYAILMQEARSCIHRSTSIGKMVNTSQVWSHIESIHQNVPSPTVLALIYRRGCLIMPFCYTNPVVYGRVTCCLPTFRSQWAPGSHPNHTRTSRQGFGSRWATATVPHQRSIEGIYKDGGFIVSLSLQSPQSTLQLHDMTSQPHQTPSQQLNPPNPKTTKVADQSALDDPTQVSSGAMPAIKTPSPKEAPPVQTEVWVLEFKSGTEMDTDCFLLTGRPPKREGNPNSTITIPACEECVLFRSRRRGGIVAGVKSCHCSVRSIFFLKVPHLIKGSPGQARKRQFLQARFFGHT